jgi:hypothetical protein
VKQDKLYQSDFDRVLLESEIVEVIEPDTENGDNVK